MRQVRSAWCGLALSASSVAVLAGVAACSAADAPPSGAQQGAHAAVPLSGTKLDHPHDPRIHHKAPSPKHTSEPATTTGKKTEPPPRQQPSRTHRAQQPVVKRPAHDTAPRGTSDTGTSGLSMAQIVARRPFEKPDNPRPHLSPTVPPNGVWLPNCAECGPGPRPENTNTTALPNPAAQPKTSRPTVQPTDPNTHVGGGSAQVEPGS